MQGLLQDFDKVIQVRRTSIGMKIELVLCHKPLGQTLEVASTFSSSTRVNSRRGKTYVAQQQRQDSRSHGQKHI